MATAAEGLKLSRICLLSSNLRYSETLSSSVVGEAGVKVGDMESFNCLPSGLVCKDVAALLVEHGAGLSLDLGTPGQSNNPGVESISTSNVVFCVFVSVCS